ncbi:hypothetical protein [Nonomuraea rubra]|uniref:hypothetical protein n=1 Tax=Nonomuraea rubra TaxID=46180 RepID=UPI0031EB681F
MKPWPPRPGWRSRATARPDRRAAPDTHRADRHRRRRAFVPALRPGQDPHPRRRSAHLSGGRGPVRLRADPAEGLRAVFAHHVLRTACRSA